MRRPRSYAAALHDFTAHEDCSPVDEVERNPRCIDIARRFGKTPAQVSKDINNIYIDSYRNNSALTHRFGAQGAVSTA